MKNKIKKVNIRREERGREERRKRKEGEGGKEGGRKNITQEKR